jgi:hypothetical protein
LAAFPKEPDNDKAVRLIDLARRVGVDMARPGELRDGRVSRPAAADRALSKAIGKYCQNELMASRGPMNLPPETVRVFLDGHRLEIGDIVNVLSTSEPIAWQMRTRLGSEAPIPNLLGQLRLQRLLIAAALRTAGDPESVRIFRSSWNLNASLWDRPEMMSQLISIGIDRMLLGLARKLPIDSDEWRTRLRDHDSRNSLLRAMEVEAIGQFRTLPTGTSRLERASRADFLDARRSFIVALRDSPVSDSSGVASGAAAQFRS